jgi:hypothetical protein
MDYEKLTETLDGFFDVLTIIACSYVIFYVIPSAIFRFVL